MTLNEARVIVYDAFAAAWLLGEERLVPYFFDNMHYDSNEVNEFVELNMIHAPGEHYTLGSTGNRIFRREGIVRTIIHTQPDGGLKRSDDLGEEILRILEGKSLVADGNTVRLTNGYVGELGVIGSYYKAEAVVQFNYQDQK